MSTDETPYSPAPRLDLSLFPPEPPRMSPEQIEAYRELEVARHAREFARLNPDGMPDTTRGDVVFGAFGWWGRRGK